MDFDNRIAKSQDNRHKNPDELVSDIIKSLNEEKINSRISEISLQADIKFFVKTMDDNQRGCCFICHKIRHRIRHKEMLRCSLNGD